MLLLLSVSPRVINGDYPPSHLSMNDSHQSNCRIAQSPCMFGARQTRKIVKRYSFKTWERTPRMNFIKGAVFPHQGKFTKLLREILSNSTFRFPSLNHHWLKYRSKSHRVPYGGLCFVGLSLETNQLPQDSSGPLPQSTLLLRQKRVSTPILNFQHQNLNN